MKRSPLAACTHAAGQFKGTQNGHVSGIVFEDIDIIDPQRYAIGVDQNGQSQGATLTGGQRGRLAASNVTINDVLFRRVRATLGKRTKSRHALLRASLTEGSLPATRGAWLADGSTWRMSV